MMLEAMRSDGSLFFTTHDLERLGRSRGMRGNIRSALEGLCAAGSVQSDRAAGRPLFWLAPLEASGGRPGQVQPAMTEEALHAVKRSLQDETARLQSEVRQLEGERRALAPAGPEQSLTALHGRVAAERRRRQDLQQQLLAYERWGTDEASKVHHYTQVAKKAADRW